jgi:hypothetical protein
VQIGATNPTRSHFKDQVIRARLRIVDLLDSERDTGLFENSGFHGQLGITVWLKDNLPAHDISPNKKLVLAKTRPRQGTGLITLKHCTLNDLSLRHGDIPP